MIPYTNDYSIPDSISEYKDATVLANECREKEENVRKDFLYDSACDLLKCETLKTLDEALEIFKVLNDWKNSEERCVECQQKKKELKAIEAERLERERQREILAKRNERIFGVGISVLFVAVIILSIVFGFIIPRNKYKNDLL